MVSVGTNSPIQTIDDESYTDTQNIQDRWSDHKQKVHYRDFLEDVIVRGTDHLFGEMRDIEEEASEVASTMSYMQRKHREGKGMSNEENDNNYQFGKTDDIREWTSEMMDRLTPDMTWNVEVEKRGHRPAMIGRPRDVVVLAHDLFEIEVIIQEKTCECVVSIYKQNDKCERLASTELENFHDEADDLERSIKNMIGNTVFEGIDDLAETISYRMDAIEEIGSSLMKSQEGTHG